MIAAVRMLYGLDIAEASDAAHPQAEARSSTASNANP